MKRTLVASAVALAVVAFAPGVVSAHSYDNGYSDKHDNWGQSKKADWHADNDKSWHKNQGNWGDVSTATWHEAEGNSWHDGHDSWKENYNATWHEDEHQYGHQDEHQGEWSDEWSGEEASTSDGTIVDALVNDGNFTTLVAAVQAAGLAETLSAPGELTVFAPTDQAFANLPAGTVESLLANPEALAAILKNHVVAGRVDGDAAVWYGEAMALSGNTLNIGYGHDGELYIEDARITMTDIMTSNGIVHVIDAVLVPKM